MSKLNVWICGALLLFTTLVGCGDESASDNNGGAGQGATCEQVCDKIGGCVGGGDPSTCLGSCAQLAQTQRDCIVDAATCGAAEACLQSNPPPQDMGTPPQDMNNTNPDPCSRCTGTQACVRQGSNYTCKNTVQSCNDKFFPDICMCLYDNIGESVEGRALCPAGVTGCSIISGKLSVDCR
jgi:hypothetical protein